MIMSPNSLARHFKDSEINLESKLSSSTYYPTANDLAKAFYKIIGKLLMKFVLKSQCDWDENWVNVTGLTA